MTSLGTDLLFVWINLSEWPISVPEFDDERLEHKTATLSMDLFDLYAESVILFTVSTFWDMNSGLVVLLTLFVTVLKQCWQDARCMSWCF